jgi:hypothetical protein
MMSGMPASSVSVCSAPETRASRSFSSSGATAPRFRSEQINDRIDQRARVEDARIDNVLQCRLLCRTTCWRATPARASGADRRTTARPSRRRRPNRSSSTCALPTQRWQHAPSAARAGRCRASARRGAEHADTVTRDLAPPNGSNETPNCAIDACATRIALSTASELSTCCRTRCDAQFASVSARASTATTARAAHSSRRHRPAIRIALTLVNNGGQQRGHTSLLIQISGCLS